MAGTAGQGKLDWQSMTVEERGMALLAAYRRDELAAEGPDVLHELDEGEGAIWRELNVSSLVELGMEVSGLGAGPVNQAHKWMLENGLRWKEGAGAGIRHFILMAPSTDREVEATDELNNVLAAALNLIIMQATQIDLLREEVARLKDEREPSDGVSMSAETVGLVRQLKALIDSQ